MNQQCTPDIIAALYRVILDRKAHPDEKSYTASLYAKGLDKILGKLGEEATELAVAGKGGERGEIVYEAADVIYHMLVLLGYYGIDRSRSMPSCAAASGSPVWRKKQAGARVGSDLQSRRSRHLAFLPLSRPLRYNESSCSRPRLSVSP